MDMVISSLCIFYTCYTKHLEIETERDISEV